MKMIFFFPARGLNRDRCIPLCTTFSRLALGTELRRLNRLCHSNLVVYLSPSGDRLRRSTAAKRDDLHSKSLFLVTNKGQWNAKSGPKAAYGNFAMPHNFRDVWSRNESVRAEICQMLHSDTHTDTRG